MEGDEACKENDELEEGECSDQDDIGMSISEPMKRSENNTSVNAMGVYRQGCIPQIIINSDQSDSESSDDDGSYQYRSPGKKACRFPDTTSNPYIATSSFINPLRAPGMAEALAEGASRKRKNNVWGAVMTEQILSQDIKQFGVNAPVSGQSRDVESYDFTIAKEDDRPEIEIASASAEKEDIFGEVVDLEREVRKHQNRKRKRNLKERLGARIDHQGNKSLSPLNVTENDDQGKVIQAIISGLEEQNKALFTRIVDAIGKEKAIDIYNKTVDVESVGGMMTNNGFRRRTPGGVYIQLMKNEPSISEDVQSAIFEQDNQKWNERKKELRKIKTAARKKWKKKGKRQNNMMDYDRPETPTPTRELEDLDNGQDNEADADGDVGDLPDRPDTPEPKDSSDNESPDDEDEEEEDDIAVAIAKAKAAILKKQKEISKVGDSDNGNSNNKKVDSGEGDGVDESVDMS